MKLYATTTSERATKGQGGKHIDIQLQGEGGQELGVISARFDEMNREYFINYWSREKCISINRIKETIIRNIPTPALVLVICVMEASNEEAFPTKTETSSVNPLPINLAE